MAQRYSPDLGPRDPIKPLRIRDEEPGGLLGVLIWWRKRGGVFWWTTILAILSIGTLVGVLVPVSRSMGHLDFRPPPDITATISADKTMVSNGDTVVLGITHINIGGSEAGAVVIDIHLPDELTAMSVLPGTPACSQAGKLERFASQEAGEITGEPGGTMKCLLGTRKEGAQGSITLEAKVGDVSDGANLNIDVWLSTYRTDTVSKDEVAWNNNCKRLTLSTSSGSQSAASSTSNVLECSTLEFVAQSLVVKSDPEKPAPGEMPTLTISYQTIAEAHLVDGEEVTEKTAIDIRLPNELTVVKLQQYIDDKAYTGPRNCSHSNELEAFTDEGKGQVTNVPGGTMTCNVGSRSNGSEGRVRLHTNMANVASGTAMNIDVCARSEQATVAAPGDCTTLALLVEEPEQ